MHTGELTHSHTHLASNARGEGAAKALARLPSSSIQLQEQPCTDTYQLHSAGLGVLSLRRAPNLGMSCIPRSLMPTSPLEPTSALEPPPLFSHPLASAVCPP